MSIACALSSLTKCENELREAASDSLCNGDYPIARLILGLAETVSGLRDRMDQNVASPVDTQSGDATPAAKPKAKPPKGSGRNTGVVYPHFKRQQDKLIKIGWSKRNKQEYEHKAPRSVALVVAGHLRKQTRDGKLFTVEDVIPIPDPEQGGELPSYQIYLALAWFRSAGIVSKHGRNSYAVDHAKITEKAMANHWNALSSV